MLNNQPDKLVIKMIILTMIIGFGSGIVGQIVSEVYFYTWRQDYIVGEFTNISDAPSIPELRRVQKFLGIQQDFEVDKSIEQISPSLVGIYLEKTSANTVSSQIFLPTDLVSNGFILTEDGWIVSYIPNSSRKFVVVHQGKVYEPEQVVIDEITGITFVKISSINLPVAVLGDSDDAQLGQLEIVLTALNQVAVVNLKSLNYLSAESVNDYVLSSEKYSELFLISDGITDFYLGSPLVNLGGEIIGVVNSIDNQLGIASVVPINQFKSVVLDVLRSGTITRSYLGIEYIDLSRTIGLNDDLTKGLVYGALVYQDPSRGAPAYISQLEEGDIITSVDGQRLDKLNNLTDLIQQYQPGDEVTLEIMRDDAVINKNVVLGVLPE